MFLPANYATDTFLLALDHSSRPLSAICLQLLPLSCERYTLRLYVAIAYSPAAPGSA